MARLRRADRVSEVVRRFPDVSDTEIATIARCSPIFARTIRRLDAAPPRTRRPYLIRRETPLQRRMRRREYHHEWMRQARERGDAS